MGFLASHPARNSALKLAQAGALVASLLVLAACSAIKPEHCPYANWNATGELHASKGFQSRLPSLYDTCLKVGVLPDGDGYIAGYQRGLMGFCTIENGWSWGQNRKVNPSICPPALAQGFDRAFNTSSSLEELDREEAGLIADRDRIEDLIDDGIVIPYDKLVELRHIRADIDGVDTERRRTRNGFAAWLSRMGLVPPPELYNY